MSNSTNILKDATKQKSVLDLYSHANSKLKEELPFLINDTNTFYNIPPPPQ